MEFACYRKPFLMPHKMMDQYLHLLNPESSLDPNVQWAIACGADIALLNGQYLNDLTTGISRHECRELLAREWDIDSTEATQDTIYWLFSEGNRIEYSVIWQAMNTDSCKESNGLRQEHGQRLSNMRSAIRLFQQHGLICHATPPEALIWDLARIIHLSRAGFDAGYLARFEALDYILRCAAPLRQLYTSWKQLSVSYQFARCVWNGVKEEEIPDMLESMNLLLTGPQSPWVALSWHREG